MGGSSDLCALLEPGEPVILMGPTGTPTETPAGETVLLVGGGLGNAVLFSIGAALRAQGSKVLYFAGYKTVEDRYKIEEIERAADTVVWCCDEAPGFAPTRLRDRGFVGNIVQAIEAYGAGDLGEISIPLAAVDRIIAIGSDGMMKAVGEARRARLKPYFRPGHRAIASINSPMQCMMKEICALDACNATTITATGTETVVILLRQPGPGTRPSRLPHPPPPPLAERRAGKADQTMDRPLPEAPGKTPGRRGERLDKSRLTLIPAFAGMTCFQSPKASNTVLSAVL